MVCMRTYSKKTVATMKRLMKAFVLVAAAAMALTSCENEVMDSVQENDTYTLTFVADAPEGTRTSVSINGDKATFDWSADETFVVLENGVSASSVTYKKNSEDKAEISATFTGDAAAELNYVAVSPANAWVTNDNNNVEAAKVIFKDSQTLTEDSYDPNADLLISKMITTNARPTEAQLLQFQRLVAVGQMNILNLQTEGTEIITSVSFETGNTMLAGRSYVNLTTGEVTEHGYYGATNKVELNGEMTVDATNGNKVHFTCIPATLPTGETYTIVVTTDKAVYTKTGEIGANALTFTAGNVRGFKVNMTEAERVAKSAIANGEYIIGTFRDGVFYYMDTEANGTRINAVATTYTSIEEVDCSIEDYKWTLEASGTNFTLKNASNKYISWSSSNTASLADGAYALIINKVAGEDYYNIKSVAESTRVLQLNKDSYNYYAFYTSDQIAELYLLPAKVDDRQEQVLKFSCGNGNTIEYIIESENPFSAPNLVGDQTTVTYTSSDESVATVDADGNVDIKGVGTTTITATAAANDYYKAGKASYNIKVVSSTVAGTGKGTAEDPYDVTRALDLYARGENATTEVYIKGIISYIKEVSTQYGNASFSISVDGTADNQLSVYRCKYLDNAKFTSEDQIQVGDEVVIYGVLGEYSNAAQIEANSYITSLKHTKLVMSNITCTNAGVNEDTLTFSWTAVENAIGYEITFDNTLVGTIKATTYTATGLEAGTSHTISVKAVADGVNYKTSEAKTCTASTKAAETGGGTVYFEKLTSAPSDWSGTYLIVYEDGKLAFNGGLTTLDAVSNTVSVTISDSKIEATDAMKKAAFTINASGHIKSASGYYVGQTSNANGLKASATTTYTNTLSVNSDGSVNAVSGGAYLRYNAASNQNRFRYYKSSSYTVQKAIHFYKLAE